MEIRNRIIKTEPIRWRKLEWLQGNLKTLSRQSFERLKQSLVKNSFVQPFNVWEDGMLWCLDGHHRKRAMEELEKEGYAIPDCLPANFIDCKDMKEAKKLLLVYSSIYANITEESLYEFVHTEELDFDSLKLEIDLPDINLAKFEAGWMTDEVKEQDYIAPYNGEQLEGLWRLGNNELFVGDSLNDDLPFRERCELTFTDAPYDMNATEQIRASHRMGSANIVMMGSGKNFYQIIRQTPYKIRFDFVVLYGRNKVKRAALSTVPQAHDRIVALEREDIVVAVEGGLRWKPNKAQRFLGGTSVIYAEYVSNDLFAYQKPVNLIRGFIAGFEAKNLYDPFVGSGTSLIAGELEEIRVFAVEKNPQHATIALRRWEQFTGKKAERIR